MFFSQASAGGYIAFVLSLMFLRDAQKLGARFLGAMGQSLELPISITTTICITIPIAVTVTFTVTITVTITPKCMYAILLLGVGGSWLPKNPRTLHC